MAQAVSGSPRLLEVTVEEASGKNRAEIYVWDTDTFEGFVKGTISATSALRMVGKDRDSTIDSTIAIVGFARSLLQYHITCKYSNALLTSQTCSFAK